MSPVVKGLLMGIVKITAVTLILNKGFKIIGKKEFGDLLGFSGFTLCAINIVKIIQYYIQQPSPTWLVKLGDIVDAILKTVM